MAFNYYEPPEKESKKPDFLEGLEIQSSENISHGMLKKEYDAMIIGYTISEHTDSGRAYITVYAKPKEVDGYITRTYKFKPKINTKGELYRVLNYFNMLEDENFDKLIAKKIKIQMLYSTDENDQFNFIPETDYIYVNFKILTQKMEKQTTIEDTLPDKPQPSESNDHKTCRACGKKVTNLLDHMESGCKTHLVDE